MNTHARLAHLRDRLHSPPDTERLADILDSTLNELQELDRRLVAIERLVRDLRYQANIRRP